MMLALYLLEAPAYSMGTSYRCRQGPRLKKVYIVYTLEASASLRQNAGAALDSKAKLGTLLQNIIIFYISS